MIVACTGCSTRFRLPDEKMRPGGVRVRCSRCKTAFHVPPPAGEIRAQPAQAPAAPPPSPPSVPQAPRPTTAPWGIPTPSPEARAAPMAPAAGPSDWSDITFGPQELPQRPPPSLEDLLPPPEPVPVPPPPAAPAMDWDRFDPGQPPIPHEAAAPQEDPPSFDGGIDPAALPGLSRDPAPAAPFSDSVLPDPRQDAPAAAPATWEPSLELGENDWRPDPPPAQAPLDLGFDPFDRISVDEPPQRKEGPEIGPLAPGLSVVAPLERSASGLDLDDAPAVPPSTPGPTSHPVARLSPGPVSNGERAANEPPPRLQAVRQTRARASGRLPRLLSSAAVVAFTLLAFVVARNGGDLRVDRDALAVAFGLAAPVEHGDFVPVRVQVGRYPTAGGEVLYVHGAISNVAERAAAPAVRVVAELRDGHRVVAHGVGWAGGVPSPETIFELPAPEAWNEVAAQLARRWAGPIAVGGEAPFLVVLGSPPADPSGLRVRVEATAAPLPGAGTTVASEP